VKKKIAAAVLTGLLAGACGGGAPAVDKPAASRTATVDVVAVVEKPIDVSLALPAELDAFESVAMFPRVAGFVKTIGVDRGSRVRAGDVLVTLDAPELRAQRAEAQSRLQGTEAQLAAARARAEGSGSTYDRLKAASATPGVVAGNELLQAQKALEGDRGQVAAAEQNVAAAREALQSVSDMEGYLRVAAPFAGVVTERNVHPGALVGPAGAATGGGTPMLRLADESTLRLSIAVPEAYAGAIAEGTAIPFSVAAYPGQTFSGRLARISHAVDVKTRTMSVELDVANGDGRLAPGTYCQVKWPVHRDTPSLFVPSASVASTTDRTFVVRVRSGRVEWVDVKTGLSSGSLVEVFGDLHAGDQVAMRGTDELRAGTSVTVRTAKPAS
jgi:membrane fusion protein, multidrug efflux system